MTRTQIEQAYDVDANGIIRSLGKFEGEMLYAPYFYEEWLNGGADDVNNVSYFEIEAEDRLEFPELIGVYGVCFEESEQGFVYCHAFDTQKEFDADRLAQSKFAVSEME